LQVPHGKGGLTSRPEGGLLTAASGSQIKGEVGQDPMQVQDF
jgi:hypothetical protein